MEWLNYLELLILLIFILFEGFNLLTYKQFFSGKETTLEKLLNSKGLKNNHAIKGK